MEEELEQLYEDYMFEAYLLGELNIQE